MTLHLPHLLESLSLCLTLSVGRVEGHSRLNIVILCAFYMCVCVRASSCVCVCINHDTREQSSRSSEHRGLTLGGRKLMEVKEEQKRENFPQSQMHSEAQ